MSDKINKIIHALQNADVIDIDGLDYTKRIFSSVTGDPKNEVVNIHAEEDGLEYSVTLTEEGLENATVTGNEIVCDDHEGEPVEIYLFKSEENTIEL